MIESSHNQHQMIIMRWKKYQNLTSSVPGLWFGLSDLCWPFMIFLEKKASDMQKCHIYSASQSANHEQTGWHWLAGNSYFPCQRIFIFRFSEPLSINSEDLNSLLLRIQLFIQILFDVLWGWILPEHPVISFIHLLDIPTTSFSSQFSLK